MSNYTHPDKPNHEDSPEEWLYSSMVFARALGFLLPQEHGVVVDLKGDMKIINPDVNRVAVYNKNENIVVTDISERNDLKEGDLIKIIDFNNGLN